MCKKITPSSAKNWHRIARSLHKAGDTPVTVSYARYQSLTIKTYAKREKLPFNCATPNNIENDEHGGAINGYNKQEDGILIA